MPRKRGLGTKKGRKAHKGLYHRPDQVVGGAEAESIWNHMHRFTRWQAERQYSAHTIEGRERTLRLFAAWCAERGLIRVQEITRPILERWQRHLFLYRKADGEPLTVRSQLAHTNPLKAFFRWLARENHILYNPASDLEMPRIGRRLPRNVMTIAEAEKVLAVPNLSLAMGVRDRAMLEVLYSTGIRRQELIDLNLYDIDRQRGVLMVREGKGKKDRVIPIGARALAWIDKYMADVRPDLASGADDGTLFLSTYGQALGAARMAEIVREAVGDSGIGKSGSCHMFRHTMATLMLENGADVRFIQAMLGHADLKSTEIYTQVSIKALKAVHTATHPARPIAARGRQADLAADDDAAAALLAALDAESGDDDDDGDDDENGGIAPPSPAPP
jgi:integrase/recombinase XerD